MTVAPAKGDCAFDLHRVARRRLRRRREADLRDDLLAAAQHAERRLPAERLGAEPIADRLRIVDRLAVDRDDDVAALQPRLGGRALRIDVGEQRAGRPIEPEAVGDLRRERLQRRAQPGPPHLLAAALGGGDHALDHIDRDGEADADRCRRTCEKIAELMPTTRPFMSTSGPPELPGLIAASVWMKKP